RVAAGAAARHVARLVDLLEHLPVLAVDGDDLLQVGEGLDVGAVGGLIGQDGGVADETRQLLELLLERLELLQHSRYLVAAGSLFLLYRLLNFSTRPAVSTSFCLPVKNGWHFEQISSRSSLRVERVTQVSPHAQWTVTSWYSGWIPGFIG